MAIDCNCCDREAMFIESEGAWCLEHYGAHLFNQAKELNERRVALALAMADYHQKLVWAANGSSGKRGK